MALIEEEENAGDSPPAAAGSARAAAHDDGPDGGPARRPTRWYLGPLAVVVALFAVLYWWRSVPLASGEAPELAGDLVGAGSIDLADLRGRPVLVHFWATWCPACRLGDSAVDAIAKDYDVITVAIESGGPQEIRRHLGEEGLSFPVIPDDYGEIATRWGIPGVPTSFVIDGKGEIRFTAVGYATELGLRGRLWAAQALD